MIATLTPPRLQLEEEEEIEEETEVVGEGEEAAEAQGAEGEGGGRLDARGVRRRLPADAGPLGIVACRAAVSHRLGRPSTG